MNRKKAMTFTLWLLAAAVMLIIFCFSAQPGTTSTHTSTAVGRVICRTFVPGYKSLDTAKQQKTLYHIDFYVRKAAHFSIYATLGCLLMLAAAASGLRTPGRWALTLPVGILYAIGDELHQRFVSGRSGNIRDVGIDSAGVLTGALVALALLGLYHAIRAHRRHAPAGTGGK